MSTKVSSRNVLTSVFEVSAPRSGMPGVTGSSRHTYVGSAAGLGAGYTSRGYRSTSVPRTPTKTSPISTLNTSSSSRPSSRTLIGSSTTTGRAPRPLPPGAGPLDSNGRKISPSYTPTNTTTRDFKVKQGQSSSVIGTGPMKADHYSTSYTSSYKTNTVNDRTPVGTYSTRPSSRSRRSSSISSLSDRAGGIKLDDEEDLLSSRRSRYSEEQSSSRVAKPDRYENDSKIRNGRDNSNDTTEDFFTKNFSSRSNSRLSSPVVNDKKSETLNGYHRDTEDHGYSLSNNYSVRILNNI